MPRVANLVFLSTDCEDPTLLGVIAEHGAALKGTLRVNPLPLSELPAYATVVLQSDEEVSRPAAVSPCTVNGGSCDWNFAGPLSFVLETSICDRSTSHI